MKTCVVVRHIAAAALIASCAGLAVAAKYDPTAAGAPARVTSAAAAAGTVSLTKPAVKLYGTGGSYNSVSITAPFIFDRLDGFQNNAVAEMLSGTPKAMTSTFTDVFINPPNTTYDQEKLANHWGLNAFNIVGVGTATGNDVLLDESITPVEVAQNPTVTYSTNFRDWSNGMGSLLGDGTALWRSNFSSAASPSQNNIETLNVTGAIGAAVSGGNKIFSTAAVGGNGIDALGAGSSFLSPPSGARLNNGNLVVGQAAFGSGAAKSGVFATVYSGVRVSWTTPPYRWPVGNYPLITDPAGAYPTDVDLRTSNHRLSKLVRTECSTETTYITFGQGSVTAPMGTPPPNNHTFSGAGFGPKVIFVDTVDTSVATNFNGFTNGFAFISADPAATFTPGTVGGRGQIGPINQRYRFIEIQGTGSNGFAQHDINSKGQVVALWADFDDTLNPVYRVHLYNPIFDTNNSCRIMGYQQPIVIAENGVNYGGTTFVTQNDSFITGLCPTQTLGTSLGAPFSGVSIDDAGNVSFFGTTESNEVVVNWVDCNNLPLGTAPDVRSSTVALCFYDAATQSLYRVANGGQNGDTLTSGTGVTYKIGRSPTTNDSDSFGAEGGSDTGNVFAFTARNGSDEGNIDSNMDGFNQDGGTLNAGTVNETAVRATVLVSLGAYTPPAVPCKGDLTNDGLRNTADLTQFLGAFGTTVPPSNPNADFNNDGFVNTADLTQFLGVFGVPCPR
ncbi:MAG: hypothetical protein ACKVZJ_05085 [Phycisphaerales bacterium]